MALGPGDKVTDNVRLLRLLGRGGMGSVWVAEHLSLDVEVAVKFVASELLEKGDPVVVERFRREARLAAKLDSPHVVRVHDHGVTPDGTPYIVMELLKGESLAERLARLTKLPPDESVSIVTQIANGLGRAHSLGIVHRDIKPHNVFMVQSPNGDEVVKILDFGIAKAVASQSAAITTSSGVLIGTPQYMSPEALMRAAEPDHHVDLWALSVVAYEALVGRPPFRGETLAATLVAITRADVDPPSSQDSDLSTALDAWFKRALHLDQDKRFADVKELATTFGAAARGEAPGEPVARPKASPAKVVQRAAAAAVSTVVDENAGTAEFLAGSDLDVPTSQGPRDTKKVSSDEAFAATEDIAAPSAPETKVQRARSEMPSAETPSGVARDLAVGSAGPSTKVSADDGAPAPVKRAIKIDLDTPAPARSRFPAALLGLGAVVATGLGLAYFGFSREAPPPPPLLGSEAKGIASAATPASNASAAPTAEPSAAQPAEKKPDPMGAIPETEIPEGFAPQTRLWVPAFRVTRAMDDEGATLLEAQRACERRGLSLCTDAQWTRACEAEPKLGRQPSWTLTADPSGLVTRGGDGSCALSTIVAGDKGAPDRVGACCSRSVSVTAPGDNKDFLVTTSRLLGDFERAANRGSARALESQLAADVNFLGREMKKEDVVKALLWEGLSKGRSIYHERCDTSIEDVSKEKRTWVADCSVLTIAGPDVAMLTYRYVRGDNALIEAVGQPKNAVLLFGGPAVKPTSTKEGKSVKKPSPPPPPPNPPMQQQSKKAPMSKSSVYQQEMQLNEPEPPPPPPQQIPK